MNEKLVTGFIRECLHLFSNQIFPIEILSIVLSYYFQAFWDMNTSHPMIKIENRRITRTIAGDGVYISAFSLYELPPNCEWRLKIINLRDAIRIGIMDNPEAEHANKEFWKLSGGDAFYSKGQDGGGIKIHTNEIVTVQLNVLNEYFWGHFKISMNGGNMKIWDLEKSNKYYLGIGLGNRGDCVEILE